MSINRILTDKDRIAYQGIIDDMFKACPDMMKRKLIRANVQQAFVVSTLLTHGIKSNILCVGCFEDTAYAFLLEHGFDIVGIDPEINYDLAQFLKQTKQRFDVVFATSVIEHVEIDEYFISDFCKIMANDALGVLTMDFKEGWSRYDPKPSVDWRLYTSKDYKRLQQIMARDDCYLIDEPQLGAETDFEFEGCKYSFSTMVFRKGKL